MKKTRLFTVIAVTVLVLGMFGCAPSAAQIQQAIAKTQTAAPYPTSTPYPTATELATQVPLTAAISTSPLISSPVVPILEANGFTENPDIHCIEDNGTNDQCNAYENGDLQERVTLYPDGWISFIYWINPANADVNSQINMLDKLFSSIWDETMKSVVDKVQSLKIASGDHVTLQMDLEGHSVDMTLYADNGQGVPEYSIDVGPSASASTLGAAPTQSASTPQPTSTLYPLTTNTSVPTSPSGNLPPQLGHYTGKNPDVSFDLTSAGIEKFSITIPWTGHLCNLATSSTLDIKADGTFSVGNGLNSMTGRINGGEVSGDYSLSFCIEGSQGTVFSPPSEGKWSASLNGQ